MLACTTIAVSLPVATWLHLTERREEAARQLRLEYRYERKLQRWSHVQERLLTYIDVALSPEVGEGARAAALRYLVSVLSPNSELRTWAERELEVAEKALVRLRKRLRHERRDLENLERRRERLIESLEHVCNSVALEARRLRLTELDRSIAEARETTASLERRIRDSG